MPPILCSFSLSERFSKKIPIMAFCKFLESILNRKVKSLLALNAALLKFKGGLDGNLMKL